MDFDAEQRLIPYLLPGERILWSSAPKQGLAFRASDLAMVPFSLMWGGFAFFWEYLVVRSNGPWFMKLWGIPFCVIGAWLIAGRFFTDAWARRNTTYGVTDKRVLVVAGGGGNTMRGIDLEAAGDVSFVERADGSGSIVFGTANAMMARVTAFAAGASRARVPGPPVLDLVPNVRAVAGIIQTARGR